MDLSDLPIRLVSPNEHSTVVAPYGFEMVCTYEYEEGEPPLVTNIEFSHPGSPANVALLTCKVGGVDLMDMLSLSQQERIEESILEQLEQ